MNSDVWNNYNPSVGWQYFVDTTDYTSNQVCYSYTTTSFMGVSYYTQFMGERPGDSNSGGYAHLPQITTLSLSGGYYDNSYNGYTIGSGYSTEYQIGVSTNWNSCNGVYGNLNLCNSAVSSGSFTETWLTSSGT